MLCRWNFEKENIIIMLGLKEGCSAVPRLKDVLRKGTI
jgi:hypothetical protein